jgi:hypothetical protein
MNYYNGVEFVVKTDLKLIIFKDISLGETEFISADCHWSERKRERESLNVIFRLIFLSFFPFFLLRLMHLRR